jgi:hypothetical protein
MIFGDIDKSTGGLAAFFAVVFFLLTADRAGTPKFETADNDDEDEDADEATPFEIADDDEGTLS